MNVGEEEGCRGEDGGETQEFIHSLAEYLADRLDDRRSIAWYRLVASTVGEGVIQDALAKALDVPASRIRKSRGALFTTLIRRHVRGRMRATRHDPR